MFEVNEEGVEVYLGYAARNSNEHQPFPELSLIRRKSPTEPNLYLISGDQTSSYFNEASLTSGERPSGSGGFDEAGPTSGERPSGSGDFDESTSESRRSDSP